MDRAARAQPGLGAEGTASLHSRGPVRRPLKAGTSPSQLRLQEHALDLNADKFGVHHPELKDLESPLLSSPVCKTDVIKDIPMNPGDLRCTNDLVGHFQGAGGGRGVCPLGHAS